MVEILARVNPWRKTRKVFYGWWLSGLAALVMVVGTVPLFQGMTAWFVVLEQTFGWNRAQLSLAFSLTRVEGSVMGPISGFLIDKLGARRMVLIGLIILGAGFISFSQTQNLWQFYLSFIIMSVGAGLGTWMPMMTVLNSWFLRRRSTAMALAMEGFSIGGVLLMPLLAWAINPDVAGRPGWRATALFIGIFTIAVAIPLSRLVRNRPEEYGEHPDGGPARVPATGAGGASTDDADSASYTWQQAVRTRSFWLITWGHACSSIVIVTITVHLGTMLTDRGFSLQTVGWIVATYTGVGAISTLVGGYVGDRVPIRIALFGFSSLQSLAVVVLILAQSTSVALLFAVLMGAGFGGRNPLTTSIRGAYFGRKAFASITGVSMIPMNVLLLAAPLFAGIMFDIQRSYTIPFVTVAIVSFFGSGLFLLLKEPRPVSSPGV